MKRFYTMETRLHNRFPDRKGLEGSGISFKKIAALDVRDFYVSGLGREAYCILH